ncbi:copper homeostasis protein cutC homolog isoform X2 [Lineus longissimus]|uniref:copper homeostasis protein cutC homolog isoform X2 n=1 Tax=Lineus longissimus TaxID=88925 RepID=UPI002B4CD332
MEVCVDSVASAVNAEAGGLFQVVKQAVKIPVFVMIRPRGGDFLYSEEEYEVMRMDLIALKDQGADGFVFGILGRDGHVDRTRCRELLSYARPLPVTFHRAIDMTPDIYRALDEVISIGCERVLTSGGDTSALDGLPIITKMIEIAKGRIIIMPGGGITERNLKRIIKGTGAREFHCSARSTLPSMMMFTKDNIRMGASYAPPEFSTKITDADRVRSLMTIVTDVWQDHQHI